MNSRVQQISILVGTILTLVIGTASSAQSPRPSAPNSAQPRPVPSTTREKAKQLYANLPLIFEKNQGQAAADTQFLAAGPGYLLSLSANGADFSLRRDLKTVTDLRMSLVGQNSGAAITGVNEVASKKNYLFGKDSSKWITRVSNYEKVSVTNSLPGVDLLYYGNQQQLEYDFDLAPQADPQELVLQFDGASKLHLDADGNLIIETAAGPVRMKKPEAWQPDSNADRTAVDVAYTLRDHGRVAFHVAPYDHKKQLVIDPVVQYATYWGGIYNPNGSVKFYDLPSSEGPPIFGMATDSAGASYIYGLDIWGELGSLSTGTIGSCPAGGCVNIFIMKFDPSLSGAASLVYTTLIPAMSEEDVNGTRENTLFDGDGLYVLYGQQFDSPQYNNDNNYPFQGLAIDGNGHLFFTGGTDNPNFPVTSNGYQTSCALNPADPLGQFCVPAMYISELSNDGTQILYSSLINGGATVPPASAGAPYSIYPAYGLNIAIDSSGLAYVMGYAFNGFPITNSYLCTNLYTFCGTDVAVKVDTTKTGRSSLVYAEEFESVETPYVATDGAGNLYWAASGCIVADQIATNFGTTPITYNGFQSTTSPVSCSGSVVKLGPTGTPTYATYLPAYGEDESVTVFGLTVDPDGRAYIGGEQTESSDPLPFPIVNGFISPFVEGEYGYVMALDTMQTGVASLVYSSAVDLGEHPINTIAGNGCGSVVLTGRTTSTIPSAYLVNQLPGTGNNPNQGQISFAMVFNTKLSGLNSLTFSSFFPDDETVPEAITLNLQGNLSVVGFAGYNIPPGSDTPAQYGDLTPTPSAYQTEPFGYIPEYDQVITQYSPYFEVFQGAVTPGCINLAPLTLAFDSEPVGSTTAAQSVVLTNTSDVNLSISSIVASDGFTESDDCGTSLAPNGFCTVNAAFHPTTAGAQTGTLTFTNSDVGSPQVVALTGTGTGSLPTATLTGISFGSEVEGTTTAAMSAALTNTSITTALTISGITITGTNAADFAITTGTNACGASVAAATSCSIYATFKPSLVGPESATLNVADNATGSPQTATLSGTGTAPTPTATLAPALSFNGLVLGATSAPLAAVLTNTSTTAIAISGITVSGNNSSDFTIAAGTNACGASLAGGATCNVFVTFAPGAVGARTATLNVADNATGSPQTVGLTGTGVVFASNVGSAEAIQAMSVIFGTAGTLGQIQVLTQGVASLDFTNPGGGTCQTGTTYPAGDMCAVNVAYTPQYSGNRNGAILLSDASGNVLATTYLPGTATGPQIVFTTNSPAALSEVAAFDPEGMTVDGNGNIYFSDLANATVYELPKSASGFGTPVVLYSGLGSVFGVAVDGARNVYVGDEGSGNLVKIPWKGTSFGTPIDLPLGSGSHAPEFVSVDGFGNVYFADADKGGYLELPWTEAGYGTPTVLPFTGVDYFAKLAVDAAGNVFCSNSTTILELPKTSTGFGTQMTVVSGLSFPGSIALDPNGDLYFPNQLTSDTNLELLEVPYSGGVYGTPIPLATGVERVADVAFDGAGDLYFAGIGGGGEQAIFEVFSGTPPSLTFANTSVGATSSDSPQTASVTNIGNATLNFSNVGFPKDFPENSTGSNLCTNTTSLTSGSGTECRVSVDFTPTTSGPLSEDVTLTDNNLNGNNVQQQISVSGDGTAAATPTATLTGISFGSELEGTTTAATTATLTNTSTTAALNISGITITGTNASDFALGTGTGACGASLAANTSCLIYATFKPSLGGAETATLNVADNATGSPQTAALTGTGTVPPPTTTLTGISFGSEVDGTTSAAMTATLTNTSTTTALTISGITISGTNGSDFAIANGTGACGASVAAGKSCLIYATFKPSIAGAETATLSVADNATGSPQTATLSGTGTAPAPAATLTGISFGSEVEGTTTAAMSATLTNTSTITELSISGITITGSNARDFAIATGTGACGGSVAAGKSCLIYATFKPSQFGADSATLTVTDNATGSPQTATLSGIGTAPAPTAMLSGISFGSKVDGTTTAAMSATLTNTSTTTALTISNVTITGANAGDFALATGLSVCGASLAANTSCLLYATFKPSLVGPESATLNVADNATGSPQTAPLSGTGVAQTITATLTAISFGGEVEGTTSAAMTSTLTNTSTTASLTITSESTTGANAADFAMTGGVGGCAPILDAGKSCLIYVTFKPSVGGAETATLDVADNATGSPTTALLTGNGTASSPTATLTGISFGSVTEATTSAAMSATLANTSTTTALTISSITITGTNGDDFTKTTGTGACGASLAAGASCSIYATFAPSLVGAESATLSVNDNATGSPQTATLSGTGTAPLVPEASLSPTTLAFGNQAANTTSAAMTATLSNTGTGPLNIVGIQLYEPNEDDGVVKGPRASVLTIFPSPDYAATTTCRATLAAGATCTISVTFDPSTTGSLPGTLSVTDNTSNSPQTAALSGTGLALGNFTVASPTAPQTVKPGGSAEYTIKVSVTPNGDIFDNPVTLSASGLPAGATASFSPVTVTPGTSTVASTMTVHTSTANALLAPFKGGSKWPIPSSLALVFGGAWALFRRKHSERFTRVVSLALLLAAIGAATMGLMGCGAGFAQVQPKTYTITVTGTSGEQTQTTTVQLTVE
jgi:hypothetical protein